MNQTRFLSACARCFVALGLIGLLTHAGKAAEKYTEASGTEGDGNFTIGPDYKIDPDLTDQGNPKGKSFEFSMRLADSKIFRGDDHDARPGEEARAQGAQDLRLCAGGLQRRHQGAASRHPRRPGPAQPGAQRARQSDDFQGPEPQAAGVHRDRRGKRRQRWQEERARSRIRHDVRPPRPLHQRRSACRRC